MVFTMTELLAESFERKRKKQEMVDVGSLGLFLGIVTLPI